jgi:hypothetical protein
MAGDAAIRRAGPTAGNFQSPPSQADERLSMSMEDRPQVRAPDPIIRERLVKDDKASRGEGIPEATAYVKRGRPFARATQSFPLNQTYLIARYPRAEADSDDESSPIVSSDSEGPAAGGGGRVFKTPPKVLAKARQQAREKRAKLASIREKMKENQQITTEERQFVMKSRGAKRLQRSLELMNRVDSTKEKKKKDKKIVAENI